MYPSLRLLQQAILVVCMVTVDRRQPTKFRTRNFGTPWTATAQAMLALRSCRASSKLARSTCQRSSSSYRTVKEFDVVFLRQQGVKFPKWHLTAPIRRDSRVRLSYGASVAASDLLGKQILERTVDDKGNAVAIHEPTLASYIVNSDRAATPIYPSDAETIVSLLDLNLTRPGEEADEDDDGAPFEVFEAGTGMGSLSLHIARALHAANPPVPAALRHLLRSSPLARSVAASGGVLELSAGDAALLSSYRSSRRAVLQTLDRSGKHAGPSLRARHAAALVRALHPNAVLVVFSPSVSQIAEFQAWALESEGAGLQLEKVLELPTTSTADGVRDGGCGGRHWDVKIVKPKPAPPGEGEETLPGADGAEDDGSAAVEEREPVVVMRPKVGGRVAGGGFIAVYRKWPAGTSRQQQPEGLGTEAEA
ncbi:hypothetical protein LEL_04089 [Akanthomyces lecanii RCEF 1005]|uniref:tRNA (adenine(58)-N(1))-methyltransferase catalytic subunit TRM61 n=1 Tax=Akanthomyces lecanii RCEF 1005 TaxID=1081108 RepID=A0A168H3K6_CORDF|nr:hypothetical protein LEL_04089 [Akanthomyces lecanii RCEF 1005]